MSVSAHYPPFVIKIRVFLSLLASPVLNICHVFVIADPPEKWFINGPRDWGSDGEVEALNCVALQKRGAYYYAKSENNSKKGWNAVPTKVKYPN